MLKRDMRRVPALVLQCHKMEVASLVQADGVLTMGTARMVRARVDTVTTVPDGGIGSEK